MDKTTYTIDSIASLNLPSEAKVFMVTYSSAYAEHQKVVRYLYKNIHNTWGHSMPIENYKGYFTNTGPEYCAYFVFTNPQDILQFLLTVQHSNRQCLVPTGVKFTIHDYVS